MVERNPWLLVTALALGLAVALTVVPTATAADQQSDTATQVSADSASDLFRIADPDANCTVDRSTALIGEPVVLDASGSEGADDYQYDRLGDGEFGAFTDVETNTVVYEIPGNYAPQVKVWQFPNETTDTARCGTLRVFEPTLSISVVAEPTDPAPGDSVQFQADPSGEFREPVIYLWDWTSDGTVDRETDGTATVSHEFDEPGTYTVQVEAISEGGATATENVTVDVQRPADAPAVFTATPAEGDRRGLVTLTANPDAVATDASIQEIEWAVDGEPIASGERLTLAFADNSVHDVSVTFLDSDGERWTTTRSVSRRTLLGTTFSVSPVSPHAGEVVTLQVPRPIDGREYGWDVGNDSEIDAFGRSLTVQFEEPGLHEIRLVAGAGEERVTRTRTIDVAPAPERDGSERESAVDVWHAPTNPGQGEVIRLGVDVRASGIEDVVVAWDLDGDGEPEAEGRSVLAAFNETGSQTVVATVVYPNETRVEVDHAVSVGVQPAESTRLERRTTPAQTTETITTTETESGDGPGFGIVAALVALVLGLLGTRGGRR